MNRLSNLFAMLLAVVWTLLIRYSLKSVASQSVVGTIHNTIYSQLTNCVVRTVRDFKLRRPAEKPIPRCGSPDDVAREVR